MSAWTWVLPLRYVPQRPPTGHGYILDATDTYVADVEDVNAERIMKAITAYERSEEVQWAGPENYGTLDPDHPVASCVRWEE